MAKKQFDKPPVKQPLRRRRSEERLHTVEKQQLMKGRDSKLSAVHKELLSKLRPQTIASTLVSVASEKPIVFAFKKTSAVSNDPNFGPIRHDPLRKRRVVIAKNGRYHNVNPDASKVTPVKMVAQNQFVSPGGQRYEPGDAAVMVGSAVARPLRAITRNSSKGSRNLMAALNESSQKHVVSLSYQNLSRPSGRYQPINNKKAQGGKSANELADLQLDDFERGMVSLGLATPDEMQTFKMHLAHVRYEHTHMFASHFGILINKENQKIDPRAPKSTFVAPAALNSEMMLFEKFVDFLLYANYRRHGAKFNEKTVDYSCEVVLVPGTTQPLSLTLQVYDYVTQKTFKQTWSNPSMVTEKPSSAMYTTLLQLLKASLDGKPLAGEPVELQFDKSPAPKSRPK